VPAALGSEACDDRDCCLVAVAGSAAFLLALLPVIAAASFSC